MGRASFSNICLALSFMIAAGFPLAGAVFDAPREGQAAVLFDPRLSDADLIRAAASADVRLVRDAVAPGAIIVDLPDESARARLRAAGAWLVADPIILGGCGGAPTLSSPTAIKGRP